MIRRSDSIALHAGCDIEPLRSTFQGSTIEAGHELISGLAHVAAVPRLARS
jgi:hypothetical protein